MLSWPFPSEDLRILHPHALRAGLSLSSQGGWDLLRSDLPRVTRGLSWFGLLQWLEEEGNSPFPRCCFNITLEIKAARHRLGLSVSNIYFSAANKRVRFTCALPYLYLILVVSIIGLTDLFLVITAALNISLAFHTCCILQPPAVFLSSWLWITPEMRSCWILHHGKRHKVWNY